jgi:hypothetical protein
MICLYCQQSECRRSTGWLLEKKSHSFVTVTATQNIWACLAIFRISREYTCINKYDFYFEYFPSPGLIKESNFSFIGCKMREFPRTKLEKYGKTVLFLSNLLHAILKRLCITQSVNNARNCSFFFHFHF